MPSVTFVLSIIMHDTHTWC